MRLVFLGPPGIGKGTQAERLAGRLSVPKISTGDIFRDAIAGKTPMGLKAKSYMDAGHLVPDSVVIGVVEERLSREDVQNGFILDGFPRTVPQAEALEGILSRKGLTLNNAVLFEAPEEEIVRRISGRLSCPNCQRVYHSEHNPAPGQTAEGEPLCACGARLVRRKDDLPETVAERLKVYRSQTAPLVNYYRAKELLVSVDAVGSIEEVTHDLESRLSPGKSYDHLKIKRGDR
ncbi:MAG TPA: adenylate kinase [Nitrospiria bacterium]|nr:adenylate kinase [Nitrospiria bacterium]